MGDGVDLGLVAVVVGDGPPAVDEVAGTASGSIPELNLTFTAARVEPATPAPASAGLYSAGVIGSGTSLQVLVGPDGGIVDMQWKARNVLGLKGANSTEFDPACAHPVINMMEEQKKVIDKGATMRLGSYECALTPGTLAHRAYGADSVRERHRHRFEVNNAYVDRLKRAGMVVSGVNPRRNLVEVIELKGHPWFVATQAHPEFQSKPSQAHPLFAAFVAAAMKNKIGGALAKPAAKPKGQPALKRAQKK